MNDEVSAAPERRVEGDCPTVDHADAQHIAAIRQGDTASYELPVRKYQARVFATARRYARLESEVEDIVQEVFIKAFQKLDTYRGEAPFEHWLMRLAVRTCYDALRQHRPQRETTSAGLTEAEGDWLTRFAAHPETAREDAEAARELVRRLLDESQQTLRGLWRPIAPQAKEELARLRAQIEAELTPPQRDRFVSLLKIRGRHANGAPASGQRRQEATPAPANSPPIKQTPRGDFARGGQVPSSLNGVGPFQARRTRGVGEG